MSSSDDDEDYDMFARKLECAMEKDSEGSNEDNDKEDKGEGPVAKSHACRLEDDDKMCAICFEEFGFEKCWKTACGHTFCPKCAEAWFVKSYAEKRSNVLEEEEEDINNSGCPVCRSSVELLTSSEGTIDIVKLREEACRNNELKYDIRNLRQQRENARRARLNRDAAEDASHDTFEAEVSKIQENAAEHAERRRNADSNKLYVLDNRGKPTTQKEEKERKAEREKRPSKRPNRRSSSTSCVSDDVRAGNERVGMEAAAVAEHRAFCRQQDAIANSQCNRQNTLGTGQLLSKQLATEQAVSMLGETAQRDRAVRDALEAARREREMEERKDEAAGAAAAMCAGGASARQTAESAVIVTPTVPKPLGAMFRRLATGRSSQQLQTQSQRASSQPGREPKISPKFKGLSRMVCGSSVVKPPCATDGKGTVSQGYDLLATVNDPAPLTTTTRQSHSPPQRLQPMVTKRYHIDGVLATGGMDRPNTHIHPSNFPVTPGELEALALKVPQSVIDATDTNRYRYNLLQSKLPAFKSHYEEWTDEDTNTYSVQNVLRWQEWAYDYCNLYRTCVRQLESLKMFPNEDYCGLDQRSDEYFETVLTLAHPNPIFRGSLLFSTHMYINADAMIAAAGGQVDSHYHRRMSYELVCFWGDLVTPSTKDPRRNLPLDACANLQQREELLFSFPHAADTDPRSNAQDANVRTFRHPSSSQGGGVHLLQAWRTSMNEQPAQVAAIGIGSIQDWERNMKMLKLDISSIPPPPALPDNCPAREAVENKKKKALQQALRMLEQQDSKRPKHCSSSSGKESD